MKNHHTKFILFVAILVTIIAMSSFTIQKKVKTITKEKNIVLTNWAEYDKVRDFVQVNICEPIRKNSKNPSTGLKSFSRCPSGYQSRIAEATDSVNADKFITGKITLYKGCSGEYVCDFRVFVNKNIALVKDKSSEEFVSVIDWLKQKPTQTKNEDLLTQKPNQVKG